MEMLKPVLGDNTFCTSLSFSREEVDATKDPNGIHHKLSVVRAMGFDDLLVPGAMLIEAVSIHVGARYDKSIFVGIKTLRFAHPLLAGQQADLSCKMLSFDEKSRVAQFKIFVKRGKEYVATGQFSLVIPIKTP